MRIFHVVADAGVPLDGAKGASAHFRALHAALVRAGADVTAFAARTPARAGAFPGRVRPLVELAAAAAEDAPDLVLERCSLGATEGLRVARAAGATFALEINAPLVAEALAHRPDTVRPDDAAIERLLWRAADLALPVSAPLAAAVADVRGGSAGVHVVRNGFDPLLFADLPPRGADLPGGPREIAFLGRPRPWHGADRLPGLLASVRARGVDARLVVVGGGPGALALEGRCGALGLLPWCRFTGDLPQPAAIRRFAAADLAVAPYPPLADFYFSPLKVVEAMAAGLALVATRQGDLPEIVGDAAVLVPPDDDASLADAVAGLLADDVARRALGARARERASASMTWDRAAARLLALVAERTAA